MTEKLKVVSMQIQTASGKVIDLSVEELQSLYEKLNEYFGREKTVYQPVVYPWYIPSYYLERYPYVTCAVDNTVQYETKTKCGTSVTYFCEKTD